MIQSIVLNGMIGAVTGYVTNNVAIRMLFKKYLGFGGVIEEKYEEFIEQMSELVERDLINHDTLSEEFDTESFKLAIQKIIRDTLIVELPMQSGNILVEEIPGIEKSVDNLIQFALAIKPSITTNLGKIFTEKSICSFISQNQFDYIINRSVQIVFENQHQHEAELKKTIYEFLSKHTVNTLVSDRTLHQLATNLDGVVAKVDFSEFDNVINLAYRKVLDILDIDAVIETNEKTIASMRFADFINDSTNLSRELIKRIVQLVGTPEGHQLLVKFIEEILSEAERIDLKLADIIEDDNLELIRAFIKDAYPEIIDKIIDLIRRSQNELESIINDSVKEVLDSSLWGKFVQVIARVVYGNNLAHKKNIIGKIISFVEGAEKNASKKLIDVFFQYIEKHSIGSIVQSLKKEKILQIPMLATLLQKNIQDLETQNVSIVDSFLNSRIGDLLTVDLSVFKTDILPKVFLKMKEDYLYSDGLKKSISTIIKSSIDKIKKSIPTDFFSKDDLSIQLDKEMITKNLHGYRENLEAITLADIVPEINAEIKWNDIWKKSKHHKMNKIYIQLQRENIFANIEKGTLKIVKLNLKKGLSGNVSNTVKTELIKKSPGKIRDMVENFMGKELKPINTLGALLGAVAGAGYAAGTLLFNAPSGLVYLTPLVYAATGILTNCIAIEMLFKPYKKINWLPFVTPGVVAKKKPEFAKNLSIFVKEMLNDNAIKNYFHNNKNGLEAKLNSSVSSNNYQIIDKLLLEDSILDTISEFTYSAIGRFVTSHSKELSAAIVSYTQEATQLHIDKKIPDINNWVVEKLYQSDFSNDINFYVQKELTSKPIGKYSKPVVRGINVQIKQIFENLVDELSIDKLKQFIYQHKQQYNKFVAAHSFRDIAGPSVTEGLADKTSKYVIDILEKGDIFDSIVGYLKKQELHPSTKLRDVFGGALPNLIKKNINYILVMVAKYIGSQREEIKAQIIEELGIKKYFVQGKIGPIVDLLVDIKLPKFLIRKERELKNVAEHFLEFRLSEIVGSSDDIIDEGKLKGACTKLITTPRVKQSISQLIQVFVDSMAKLKLKSLLQIVRINNIRDMTSILNPLLVNGVTDLLTRIDNSSADLTELSTALVTEVIDSISDDTTFGELLQEINLHKEIKGILSVLKSDHQVRDSISELLLDVIYKLTAKGDIYSDTILQDDIAELITSSIEEDKERLKSILIPHIKEFFCGLNGNIEVETKDAIFKFLIDAFLRSLEINLNTVIQSIDLQKVVEQEVNRMHPNEVETMFYSFAKEYFKKLKWYGWIGGVFGLVPLIIILVKYLLK